MNRLTWLMGRSWWNARMIWLDYDDGLGEQACAYWMREFWMYQALCRCIRRGYKPVRKVEE